MKRREFIEYATLAGTGVLLNGAGAFAQGARTPGATVQTTSGQVRGVRACGPRGTARCGCLRARSLRG